MVANSGLNFPNSPQPSPQPPPPDAPYTIDTNGLDDDSKVNISFHNLRYSVKKRKSGKLRTFEHEELLKGISGCFEPGLNAIIGPAGSGKTLLMEVLTGLKDPAGMEGSVLVNGKQPPPDFHQRIAYITQEDMLMGTLTVRENISFSADLRLAQSQKEKQASVNSIISQLQLDRCADSKVGDEWTRGVSGGERRRTNIAMEMLKQPRILFLDEPTSGLDAHTAFSVVSLLHRLSLEDRTIILSIHQPRYSIFKLFHSLTILLHGQTVFHGPSHQALPYFTSIGHTCEQHDNPPDFFLDVIWKDPTPHPSENPFCNLFTKSSLFQQTHERLKLMQESSKDKTPEYKAVREKPYATNFLTQMKYVSKRSIQNFVRNPLPLLTPVIINVCFAVLISLIFFNVFRKITSVQVALQNRTGALYFVVANQMYNCCADTQVLSKHRLLFLHEARRNYYRTSSYLASKVMVDVMGLKWLSVLLFSLITYPMFGLTFNFTSFLNFYSALFMISVTSSALSLLVSACFTSPRTVHLLVNFGYVISVLFSGFFSNVTSLYSWLKWMSYFSFLRYSLNNVLISQMKGLTMEVTNRTHVYLDTHSATERLDMLAVKHADAFDVWSNLLVLHSYACLLLAATYLRLRFTPKHK